MGMGSVWVVEAVASFAVLLWRLTPFPRHPGNEPYHGLTPARGCCGEHRWQVMVVVSPELGTGGKVRKG
jgi:hypothetical protein